METILLRLFQSQVLDQCRHLLYSYEGIEARRAEIAQIWEGIGPMTPEKWHDSATQRALVREKQQQIWGLIQALLTATANISKALWGEKGKYEQQREPLRQSIGVTNSSPLIPPSTVRNSFEHFDERLDDWWRKSPNHNYMDGAIATGALIGGDGAAEAFPNINLVRAYDPSIERVSFWGDTFDIAAIVQEIERIKPALIRETARPHWDE